MQSRLSRRDAFGGAAALCGVVFALDGCGKPQAAKAPGSTGPVALRGTLEWAVQGEWRLPQDRARDGAQHPVDTLTFFGIRPGDTVVEMWSAAGWWTEILAPYLMVGGGKLYAANPEPVAPQGAVQTIENRLGQAPALDQLTTAFKARFASHRDVYGTVEFTTFGPGGKPPAPAGAADLVLFWNLNNWMAAGLAERAFKEAFAALKSGGALGIVQARSRPDQPQDALAASGYVQPDYVKQLAAEAGFKFDKSSEINANPKDTKDHPFGVLTLPPTRRSSPLGKPDNPLFNHQKYDKVGEPDRMTLRFVKP